MNLKYKGINNRGRLEWLETDLVSNIHPEGEVIEEWQLNVYRPFAEGIEKRIGRELTKSELRSVLWLSGSDKDTVDSFTSIINAAYENGRKN